MLHRPGPRFIWRTSPTSSLQSLHHRDWAHWPQLEAFWGNSQRRVHSLNRDLLLVCSVFSEESWLVPQEGLYLRHFYGLQWGVASWFQLDSASPSRASWLSGRHGATWSRTSRSPRKSCLLSNPWCTGGIGIYGCRLEGRPLSFKTCWMTKLSFSGWTKLMSVSHRATQASCQGHWCAHLHQLLSCGFIWQNRWSFFGSKSVCP